MHSLFSVVLFVVCGLGILAALWSLTGSAERWDAYTKRGLVMERMPTEAASPGALAAERDDEIRQLVDAANHRRARRGEAPLDVDAEVARLTAGPPHAPDAGARGPKSDRRVTGIRHFGGFTGGSHQRRSLPI